MEGNSEATALNPFSISSSGGTFQPREGLSSLEAARRLAEDGPNVLDPPRQESFLEILVQQMQSVIFLLTTTAALISAYSGDLVKARVLVGIVVIVCLVNTIGEYTGQDAGEALGKMTASVATVLRDNNEVSVKTEELVVGDVVKIQMGEIVPADMVVLESIDLQTNESVLTGEAKEQVKTTHPKDADAPFLSNMMYNGTSVVAGKGKAEVVATGMQTQVGLIAQRLGGAHEMDMNPLHRSANRLGTLLAGIVLSFVLIASAISYLKGYQDPEQPCPEGDTRCLVMASLVKCAIMAVALIPHALPIEMTVMMRVGRLEIAKRQGLVTRLTAVDHLGATTVICTDKTGTLTEGKMTAQVIVGMCNIEPQSEVAKRESIISSRECSLGFYPLRGYSPNGGIFNEDTLTNEAKKRMDAMFDARERRQAFAEPAVKDLSEVEPTASSSLDVAMAHASLTCGFLSCYGSRLSYDSSAGAWECNGNMTDAAIKVAAAKAGLWDDEGRGAELQQRVFPRVAELEVPFTSNRKMMATIHKLPRDGQLATLKFHPQATHVAVLKGAPDRLMPHLKFMLNFESGLLDCPGGLISAADLDLIEAKNKALALRALRSVMIAVRPISSEDLDSLHSAPGAEDRLQLILGNGLCFLSMWGIYDPPRATVPASVEECHRAGIRVVMITGDQQPTAFAIGKQTGIIREDDPPSFAQLCAEMHEGPSTQSQDARRISIRASQLLQEGHESQARQNSFAKRPSRDFIASPRKQDGTHYRSDEEIDALTGHVNVWARAQPVDKVTIVESLQRQGHIAAMTGDGVNDAPALRKASVGVAMGISGTAVAQNASDLILLNDEFTTIVAAIKEGRRIYGNMQKYVTANMSCKAGECSLLLGSILAGVPVPIRPVSQLFNMFNTHAIAAFPYTFEEADPWMMRVPPRKTEGDLIVTPKQWLYRWLPLVITLFTLVHCSLRLGLRAHTGFLYNHELIPNSQVDLVGKGEVACETAGKLNGNGVFIESARPFHCRCLVKTGWLWGGDEVPVEQWGQIASEEEEDKAFDPFTGSFGDFYELSSTPWSKGTDTYLEKCKDSSGVERWCWKGPEAPEEMRPLLSKGRDCATYGTAIAQSMSFATIQLSELMLMLSQRTNDHIFARLTDNTWMIALFLYNCVSLLVWCYFAPLTKLFGLAPLRYHHFVVIIASALCAGLASEVSKVLYMKQIRIENAHLEKEALKLSRGSCQAGELACTV